VEVAGAVVVEAELLLKGQALMPNVADAGGQGAQAAPAQPAGTQAVGRSPTPRQFLPLLPGTPPVPYPPPLLYPASYIATIFWTGLTG